eukprot:3436932-Rhodomonas_salina.1
MPGSVGFVTCVLREIPNVNAGRDRGRLVDVVAAGKLTSFHASVSVHRAPHIVHPRIDVDSGAVLRVPGSLKHTLMSERVGHSATHRKATPTCVRSSCCRLSSFSRPFLSVRTPAERPNYSRHQSRTFNTTREV